MRSLNGLIGIMAVLLMATLACNIPSGEPDSAATVQAIYVTITAQASTGSALTQPAGAATSPSMPSSTASPTAGVTPTAPQSRSGNGSNLVITGCAAAIAVDANDADWASQAGAIGVPLDKNTWRASEWLGTSDLSGSVRLCWNNSGLYLFIDVTDDVHVQTQRDEISWKGDEVEIVVDTDLRGDFYDETWDSDDIQLGLSPGNFADLAPASYQYHPGGGIPRGVEMAARPAGTAGNYQIEAGLLWDTALGFRLGAGQSFGLCVALSDNDHVDTAQQDSMVSHCPRLVIKNPTTWVTVTLE